MTATNRRLVASLDDDGVLRYREDKGTGCASLSSPTCTWYRTDHVMLTVSLTADASVTPTAAQIVAAVNAKLSAGWARRTTTGRTTNVTGTIMSAWLLGRGATVAAPWGLRKNVPQVHLARS